VRGEGVFLRTSKTRSTATVVRAVAASRWETAIAFSCLVVGVAILARGAFVLGIALAILCFWQALIYGSAFVTSLSAIRSGLADARPPRYRRGERPPPRRVRPLVPALASLGAVAVFIALAGAASAPNVAVELNAAAAQAPLLPPAALSTPAPSSDPASSPPPGQRTTSGSGSAGSSGAVLPSGSPASSAPPPTAPPATPSPAAQPTFAPGSALPAPAASQASTTGQPSALPTPVGGQPSSVPTPAGGQPSSAPTPAGGRPSAVPTP
jgi:hypothetical protein